MQLPYRVDSIQKIPERFRELYKSDSERGGYVLNIGASAMTLTSLDDHLSKTILRKDWDQLPHSEQMKKLEAGFNVVNELPKQKGGKNGT